MRALVTILAIALCVLSGHAQAGGRKHQGTEQKQTAGLKVDDKAYRNALGSLPNKKYDPWQAMR